ncbi:hypothetical protein [Paenibacillus sp. PL91]|uniref:hypothetical protein n=1 Tax=Paenibacillus sp. PL91 TaxID=2729538 RepID=UPI00145C8022|nr:hypothetical protein [Paenibacillus sp. PL91]MBC9204181.1 hypothetical protein [Paenibacillus sp. PL91]
MEMVVDKMEKARISPGQLFTLIVLFDMGTAILRVLAMSAGKVHGWLFCWGLQAG